MGFFSRFEDRAEGMIEGSSGRGGIEPVKLAKRAAKEMEREKMVGVGHEYAPTLYNVLVSPDDDERMSGYYPSLAGEVETYLTSAADRGGLVFDCPPLVRFIVDDGLKRGKFDIIAESVSPAIISELRHEEMVHYGIEEDIPMANSYSYEDSPRGYEEPAAYEQSSYGQDSYGQPAYDARPLTPEPEPEPYRREEPAAYEPHPAAEPARAAAARRAVQLHDAAAHGAHQGAHDHRPREELRRGHPRSERLEAPRRDSPQRIRLAHPRHRLHERPLRQRGRHCPGARLQRRRDQPRQNQA